MISATRPLYAQIRALDGRRRRRMCCAMFATFFHELKAAGVAGDAARISHADGGDGEGFGRPPGRGFLLPVARRAGEGRAQSRQVRPRVRPCVQGPRPRRGGACRRNSGRMAQEAHRKISHRGRKEADRGDGRPRQASRNAAPAACRAERPPSGRQEMDRHRRHLAVRRLWLQSRRRAHRPGQEPQFPRREGVGQARVQGSRRTMSSSARATSRSRCGACANSPAPARPTSSISTAPSRAPRTRAISTS